MEKGRPSLAYHKGFRRCRPSEDAGFLIELSSNLKPQLQLIGHGGHQRLRLPHTSSTIQYSRVCICAEPSVEPFCKSLIVPTPLATKHTEDVTIAHSCGVSPMWMPHQERMFGASRRSVLLAWKRPCDHSPPPSLVRLLHAFSSPMLCCRRLDSSPPNSQR